MQLLKASPVREIPIISARFLVLIRVIDSKYKKILVLNLLSKEINNSIYNLNNFFSIEKNKIKIGYLCFTTFLKLTSNFRLILLTVQ